MPTRELAWLDSIRREHAALTTLTARVSVRISGSDSSINVADLAQLLEELHAHCREHMMLEEVNGYLEPVRRRRPDNVGLVDELEAEHPKLLTGLAKIAAETRGNPSLRDLELIVERLSRWLADMRSHEDRETTLLLDAFDSDLNADT